MSDFSAFNLRPSFTTATFTPNDSFANDDSGSPYANFNATSSRSSDRDVMASHRWLGVMFVLLYSAIFLLGLSGNALVVYVVARNKAMQTITNTFITNLAVSDIMMCLLAVPFTPAGVLLSSWPFGETICHLMPMALGVSVHVLTLTSTAIAIDRYFVIVHPFKPRMSLGCCGLVIVAIWITSVSISLPLAFYQKVRHRVGLVGKRQ